MQSLRSVITQATRGGRLVLSRRNFSSSSAREGKNGAVEREWTPAQSAISLVATRVSAGFAFGYIAINEKAAKGKKKIKKQKKEYLKELETLQSCRSIAADM